MACRDLPGMGLLMGLAACVAPGDGGGGEAGPLLPHDGWAPAEPGPFANEVPDDAWCSELAWHLVDGRFEVQSDLCLYGVYGQPLTSALAPGEALRFTFAWGERWAPEPTTAGFALAIGEDVVWEVEVEVPGPPGQLEVEVEATEAVPRGVGAWLRARNHGANAWAWSDVEANP